MYGVTPTTSRDKVSYGWLVGRGASVDSVISLRSDLRGKEVSSFERDGIFVKTIIKQPFLNRVSLLIFNYLCFFLFFVTLYNT